MPYYIVNTNVQPESGDHEVHEKNSTCTHYPEPHNQLDLGFHVSCHSAVREAKKTYPTADGCYYCCNECHTS